MSEWYYAENNEQKGPVNEAELKEKLAGNKLPADSLVWKDGMDNWTPANQVSAFSFRQPPAPAKIQPAAAAPAATSATNASTPATAEPASPEPSQSLDVSTFFGKPESLDVTDEDVEKNKVIGILAYVPLLFWLPLVAAKDSPFAKYHANQAFVLFVISLSLWFVLTVLSLTCGFLFSFLATLISLLEVVILIPIVVLIVLGIINAANGKCVPLPVIGGARIKIAK